MSFEHYKPSKSEVAEAESNMSHEQEVMSDIRTEDYDKVLERKDGKKIIQDLVDGKYDLVYKHGIPFISDPSLTGMIGDSKLEMHVSSGAVGEYLHAKLDGEELDDKTAEKLWEKYLEIAKLQDKQPAFLGMFKGKRISEEKAEMRIDIENK